MAAQNTQHLPGKFNPELITQGRNELAQINQVFWKDAQVLAKIEQSIQVMALSLQQGGKILACGNGGSMCDAMHFAEELSGRFKKDRPPLAALAISDPAHLSCTANDYGYDEVFARYVTAVGKPGDVLLAISTSGNSANVIKAVSAAQKREMSVITLLGKDGGKLKAQGEISFVVPSVFTSHIQETHIQLIHLFIEGIEQSLFPANI